MKREVREQRLHDLVERYAALLSREEEIAEPERCVALIAHSPESPIALALAAHLPALTSTGATVRAIFAVTTPEPLLLQWQAQAQWVRWARDKRLLEAHEQLVLGCTRCWSGDAMRRGSTKTDLFESLNEGSTEMAGLALHAFTRIAGLATPVRPRRVTASLNAQPHDRAAPAAKPVDNVVPAPEVQLQHAPAGTRH